MAATTDTFNFAYELTGDPLSGFKITDAAAGGNVDPIAGHVKVKDANGGTDFRWAITSRLPRLASPVIAPYLIPASSPSLLRMMCKITATR